HVVAEVGGHRVTAGDSTGQREGRYEQGQAHASTLPSWAVSVARPAVACVPVASVPVDCLPVACVPVPVSPAGASVAEPRAIRTTAPESACKASRTALPTELVGSHTTWSGISVSRAGSVMVPAAVLTASGSPS